MYSILKYRKKNVKLIRNKKNKISPKLKIIKKVTYKPNSNNTRSKIKKFKIIKRHNTLKFPVYNNLSEKKINPHMKKHFYILKDELNK